MMQTRSKTRMMILAKQQDQQDTAQLEPDTEQSHPLSTSRREHERHGKPQPSQMKFRKTLINQN